MHPESENSTPIGADGHRATINAPVRTLSPVSFNAMNKLNLSSPPREFKPPNGTIRPVPTDPTILDATPGEETRRSQGKSDSIAMSYSTLTQARDFDAVPPLTRQNSIQLGNGLVRTISSEFGPTKAYSNTPLQSLEETAASNGTPQWSAAVGKANLGKSGRVIERLMGENDMLKRDLNIERLRAEESNQAVKMAEGKMEALVSEYETRLHDAAINKTLLKRRERQVADFKAQIETEKGKAAAALERERGWREEMEKLEEESKQKVDDAQLFAALMEGRNKTMTGHWKDQEGEVSRAVEKIGGQIETIVQERRGDDARMNTLQSLCDQQAGQLKALEKEKEGISAAFEAYKTEQENLLRDIKEKAAAQERANEETLAESQRVLGELRWALQVKKNVKGAQ